MNENVWPCFVAESEDRMKDKIKEAIEELFENAPDSEEIKDLKEEMISNAEAKYEDLVQRGFTEEQSYTMVIGSIGDIQDLFNEIGNAGDEKFEDAKKDYWAKQGEYWDKQCEYWEWQAENIEEQARKFGKQAKDKFNEILESGVFEEIAGSFKKIIGDIGAEFQNGFEKATATNPGAERSFATDGVSKIVVEVQNCAMDIDVQLTTDDQIMIQESLIGEESQKGSSLEFSLNGNTLKASYPFYSLGVSRRGVIRVFLPESYAGTLGEMKLTTSSGNITLEDLGAAKQIFETVSGDVKGACSIGEINVTTVSGDVEFESLEGEAQVRTVSGDITVKRAVGSMSVSTISGDMEVNALEGNGIARSTSGDVNVNLVKAGEKLEVSTMSGDANLTIPKDASVQMTLNSVSGDVSSFCDHIQTEENVEYVRNGKRAVGTVGTEPFLQVKVSTTSGDIAVNR